MIDRRAGLIGSLAVFSVFAFLGEARAARRGGRDRVGRWVARHDELARGLAGGGVSQAAWRAGVEGLAAEVDIGELSAEIARSRVSEAGVPFGKDPRKRFVEFLDEIGERRKLHYAAAVFEFGRDNVITPHGHKNMASAHLVVEGKIRVRTFDRIASEEDALIITPTADLVAEPGVTAVMTSERDNIHWFASRSERAATFDVILSGLDPGAPDYVIEPVDPLAGTDAGSGSIRAPILTFDESMRRYSADL